MNIILSNKLPFSIKYMIRSYCGGTPSAEAIKKEVRRILPIIESDRLSDHQTIWSIMSIYWFEYYASSYKIFMYQQIDIPLTVRYELNIAKGVHLCMTFNNNSYECIPNHFHECLHEEFLKKYDKNKWWEQYLTQLNPLSKLDF